MKNFFLTFFCNSKFHKNKIKKQVDFNLKTIDDTLKSPFLATFLNDFNQTFKSKSENQYLSYIGLNFTSGVIDSIKFYVHFFNEMTESELLRFLPTTADYLSNIDRKNNDTKRDKTNVGTIIEIKFKKEFELPTKGFFYLLKNEKSMHDSNDQPILLQQEIIEHCQYSGINFEYDGIETTKKMYYYFDSPFAKSYFESKFKKSIPGNLIEYSEGSKHSKINSYFTPKVMDFSFDKTIDPAERESIKLFSEKFGLKVFGQGSYHTKSTNSYYFREYSSDSTISNELRYQYSDIFRVLKIIPQ